MEAGRVSATEFKASRLDLLDPVSTRQIDCLEITKNGRVVAVLVPSASHDEAARQLHGSLRGSVVVPEGVDLTAPALDEVMEAEFGDRRRCVPSPRRPAR